jgi:hypothetical protein
MLSATCEGFYTYLGMGSPWLTVVGAPFGDSIAARLGINLGFSQKIVLIKV